MPLPHERPAITTTVSTADLPALPQRDRSIPAGRWQEAPAALRSLGAGLGEAEEAVYLRRIGRYLLWRAGSPQGAFRAMAINAGALDEQFTFEQAGPGEGSGVGPDGARHDRFRTWKEALRDHA